MHIHLTAHTDKFIPLDSSKQFALVLGNFDGIHRGHKFLIETLIKESTINNNIPLLVTFNPSTKTFFNNENRILLNLESKLLKLQNLGINHLALLDFNEIYQLSAQEFFNNILLKNFNPSLIIVGEDFKFGSKLTGDTKLLKSLCNANNIGFKTLPKLVEKDIVISSSNIKNFLSNNNLALANSFLGYNYQITSKVILGNQLGRTLGFNTANLIIKPYATLLHGVYITKVFLKKFNKYYNSISNFGIKPTIKNNNQQELLEVHIFDFNQDIYGEELTVEFLSMLRKEKKFNSLKDLKIQIEKDTQIAKDYFKKIIVNN
jgi:riboflavin kinase/FMN adenylyltransferase